MANTVIQIGIIHSDGVGDFYPQTTDPPPVASNGGECTYDEEERPGSSKDLLYRSKLAEAIVSKLFPDVPRGYSFILRALPRNYRIFTRVKLKGGLKRTDSYVWGHPSGKKYRSTAEIEPHILHLAKQGVEGLPDGMESPYSRSATCPCLNCKGGASLGSSSTPRARQSIALHGRDPPQMDSEAIRRATEKEAKRDIQLARSTPRRNEVVWVKVEDTWYAAIVIDAYVNPMTLQMCHDENKVFQAPGQNIQPWIVKPPPSEIHSASKVSGSKAECTITPIGRMGDKVDGGVDDDSRDERYYRGLFLGAEKIWLGDIIRIPGRSSRNRSDINKEYPYGIEDIMVVEQIVWRNGTEIDPTTQQSRKVSNFFVLGKVFTTDNERSFEFDEETTKHLEGLLLPAARNSWTSQFISGQNLQATYPGPWKTRILGQNKYAELSVACVFGRWYPTTIMNQWKENRQLFPRSAITKFVPTRMEALGISTLNGVHLNGDGGGTTKKRRIDE